MSNESSQPSIPLTNACRSVGRSGACVCSTQSRSSAKCEYFVAGATARDLILVNVHGLRPGRATRDIDFGIAVESWEQFELSEGTIDCDHDFAAVRGHNSD